MRSPNAILLVSGLVLLSGCYGKKTLRQPITIEEIATDVQEIRENQVSLSSEMRKLEEQIASQAASVERLQAENQTLYEQLGDRLTAIDNKLKDAIGRSSGYGSSSTYWSGGASDRDPASGQTEDTAPDRGAPVNPSPDVEPDDSSPSPEDVAGLPPEAQAKTIYEQAYLDLTRGNYPLAILGFTEFLRRSPESDLGDNAQYWIGESYYAQKDYQQAITEFEKVVDRFSSGDKVPSALLKIGFSQINVGDQEAARVTLTDVTRRFPDSEESRLAREKLRTID